MAPPTMLERFIAKMDTGSGCWLWTASCFPQGYGRFTIDSRPFLAHRIAYELFVGPIRQGLYIDHLCHNADPKCRGGPSCRHRRCVNPAHLEPVTPRQNTLRSSVSTASRHVARSHCLRGHPLDGVTTTGGRTALNRARYCKTCLRERSRRYAKAVA